MEGPTIPLDGERDQGNAQPNMFEILCENVHTSMIVYNAILQEFFEFKDELLKHALPPKLLANLTLLSSKLFRSFSEFTLPVNELARMVRVHSTSWQERAESLKSIRSDYDAMRTRLNIALKRIKLMATEEEKIKKERRLGNWERLFLRTMESKSHGRRWKFRIEPLKRKMKEPRFNPYLSEPSDDESDEDDEEREYLSPVVRSEENLSYLDSESEEEEHTLSKIDQNTQTMPPPITETVESAISTEDPDYDQYLLVQLYRPRGLLTGKDVCCTIACGQQYYTSEVYPGKTAPGSILPHQSFHFKLSDDDARTLPPDSEEPLDSVELSQITLTVYPENIAHNMAAFLSLQLRDLQVTDDTTLIVPPGDVAEGKEVELNWEEIDSTVQGLPKEYHLKLQAQRKESTAGDGDEPALPLLPMLCHRVKVQRYKKMQRGTETVAWDRLVESMGYRLAPETQSRAVSMICFEDPPQPELVKESLAEERVTQEELAALSLQHAEEIRKLQKEFGQKLNSLTRTLNQVRADRAREVEHLEQALIEAEQKRGANKGRNVTEIRSLLARKKKLKVTHGLPNWGEDLPDDFFERMELFAEESVRKQEELTERIKREVSQACEKQLATQHKLAPGVRNDIDNVSEDVTLPALFMPTPCTKNLVFTPRAHRYFHPPGSSESRVTQPPSVFKLPALNSNQLHTLNLFEMSQQYSHLQTRPRETTHQTPCHTPAPPPSICSHYHPGSLTSSNAQLQGRTDV